MYSDKRKARWPLALAVVLLLCALLGAAAFRSLSSADITEESAEAVRSAVERSARQCYVVEGVYPPNLEYLKDYYGLQVNERDFYVTYEAFASNLPPTVRVTMR